MMVWNFQPDGTIVCNPCDGADSDEGPIAWEVHGDGEGIKITFPEGNFNWACDANRNGKVLVIGEIWTFKR